MAIPAGRIDDKVHAARFRAKAGLIISFEPNYCPIGIDYLDVDFSPVPIFDLANVRVCEDVDVAWDATSSYSPFDTLVGPPPAGTTWHVDWGDGNTSSGNNIATASGNYGAAANEWDLDAADAPEDGVYTITFTLTDDNGLQTVIERQIQVIQCVGLFAGIAGLGGGDGPYIAPGAGTNDWVAGPGDLDGNLLNVNAVLEDDSNSGFWIATDGGIAYSGDNGQHWKRIENSAPPNSWNDGVAPVGSDIRYIGIVQSKGNANQLFALARWQEAGGNWRSAIRYSFDKGQTWTWHNLGGNRGLAAANWGYPYSFVQDAWCWDDNPGVGISRQPPSKHEHIDTANVTQAAGEGGARITWEYNKVNTDSILQTFVIDLGVYIVLSNVTQVGGINCQGRTGDCTDTMTWVATVPIVDFSTATLDPQTGHGPDSCPITVGSQLLLWDSAVVGYPPDNVTRTALAHLPLEIFRYAAVTFSHTPQFYTGQGYNELLFQWFQFYPHVVYDEVYVIGADTSQDGQYLHVTTWEGEALRHRIYELSEDSFRLLGVVSLGGATLAQVQARTYWAKPFCPNGYTGSVVDKVYIYGRMNHSTLGIVQLIESDNRGETTADLSDGTWTTEWIGAMEIDPLYPDTIYVCLNSGAPRMWISDDGGTTWSNVSALGFQVETMDLNPDFEFEIIIGNRAAAANPIKYSMDDGLSWFTVSAGLPAAPAGGIGGIYLISERV